MSSSDFIDTVERFILDIIGTVVPGLALIFGCCYVANVEVKSIGEAFTASADTAWIFIGGAAFVLGHGLTAFGYQITLKIVDKIASSRIGPKLLPFVVTEAAIEKKLTSDPIFQAFRLSVIQRFPSMREVVSKDVKLRVWRSLAISLIQKDNQIVYRFTFIALLNLGIASAICISVCLWVSLWGLAHSGWNVSVREMNIGMPVALFAWTLFIERFYSFNRRAIQVPFSMALVRLNIGADDNKSEIPASHMDKVAITNVGASFCVYLAGGFKSRWQDTVKLKVPDIRYLDPRSHGLTRSEEYTAWDLAAIRQSDCVFANLEASNPAG